MAPSHSHHSHSHGHSHGHVHTTLGLYASILLAAVKIAGGRLSGSSALVADGVHTGGDAATDLATAAAVRLGGVARRRNWRFVRPGYIEGVTGIVIGALVVMVGMKLGQPSLEAIRAVKAGQPVPGQGLRHAHAHELDEHNALLAAALAVVSIVVNVVVYIKSE